MSAAPAPITETPPAKTYTEAELNERLEAVRKEEKQKLYSEIDSLKNQLKDSDLTTKERDALRQQVADAEKQIAAINAAKKADGSVDPLLLSKQVAEDTRKAMSQEYDSRFSEMQQKLNAAEERGRKQELASYRQSLIAAANGRIIPAMVIGNTKEELDAAATESKAQFEAIAAPANPAPSPAPSVNPPPIVAPRAANGGDGRPPASGLDAFKRTGDTASYAQNRKTVLAQLKQQHG